MKKLYFLAVMLITATLSFGQATDLYFSMYGEGSSSNKFIEIFNGTNSDVDLAPYVVNLYANGGTNVSNTLDLTGTLKSGDVYVIVNASADQLIKANADIESPVTYFNGDDALELTKGGTSIDIIGVIGEDPGTAWAVAGVSGGTKDHTLTRKSTVCSPNTDWTVSAGTDTNDSEWVVTGNDSEWSSIGSHIGCGSTPPSEPTISISTPVDGDTMYVLPGEEAKVNLEFSIENFVLGTDGRIVIKDLDGSGMQVPSEQSSPIYLHDYGNLTKGSHTVTIALQDASDQYLDPAVEATIAFTVDDIEDVADIAALRTKDVDSKVYRITGEFLVLYEYKGSTYSNVWVRDNSGAIEVHISETPDPNKDEAGTIYKNAIGHLKNYNGLLQFIPETENAPELVSTGNDVTAIDVTIDEINAGDYESNLVKITSVTINDRDDGDGTFQGYKNYETTDSNSKTVILRTGFSGADYLGEAIPTTTVDLVGIVGNYKGTYQITPRSSEDFIGANLSNKEFGNAEISVYPNPVVNSLTFKSNINKLATFEVYNINGQLLIATEGNLSKKVLDVSKLNHGVYFLKVSSVDNTQSFKFTK